MNPMAGMTNSNFNSAAAIIITTTAAATTIIVVVKPEADGMNQVLKSMLRVPLRWYYHLYPHSDTDSHYKQSQKVTHLRKL